MSAPGGELPDGGKPKEPVKEILVGNWAVGLCGCCDVIVPNCCMSMCCPCVGLAQIYARTAMMSYGKALALFGFMIGGAFICRIVGQYLMVLQLDYDTANVDKDLAAAANEALKSLGSGSWGAATKTATDVTNAALKSLGSGSKLDGIASALGSLDTGSLDAALTKAAKTLSDGIKDPTDYSTIILLLDLLNSLLGLAFLLAVCQARSKLRARFRITGSGCEDFFISWCCSCCAIAQMATHVKSYKGGVCSFGSQAVLPAYEGA